ncbi:MAG TPA: ATP-binding protein, partial [Cyclobacteriaceae bacterium]|nr:ATP-binding protein [Cyclobacteriaceae bacterium]
DLLDNTSWSGFRFSNDHLEGTQPVVHESKKLGTLYLKSDLKALDERLILYGMVVIFVMVFAFLIAFVLSHFLSKNLSEPVLALSEAATAISDRQDYSVRAKKLGNDEIGHLTDAFNQMLDQIQSQNLILSRFNRDLEKRVTERTVELKVALKEQQVAEKELNNKNKDLSRALEELQITKGKLTELNNELEQRVKNRTKELMESSKAIRAKNLELEKVNIDLDNFIYTASHDLKSPLSNLEALIDIVKEEIGDIVSSEQLQFLDMMETSIMRLKKTIVDLAEITKVQKNFDEEPSEVSFQSTIEDIKKDLLFGIDKRVVTIEEQFDVQQILYPTKSLRSVLYNLLSNAIKYRSPDRPAKVWIKTYLENGSVVLMVEDNGIGIEQQHLPKLFTMFKRFHYHVEGTGIGLYIIKRTVENHGGRIEYESKGDQGSIFRVYF